MMESKLRLEVAIKWKELYARKEPVVWMEIYSFQGLQ